MKAFIRIYSLSVLLAIAFVTQASGQSVGNSNSKSNRDTKTSTVKKTVYNRVPSTKVTYKTPVRKVVSVRSVPDRKVIKYKGQDYYYANNKYYTQSRGRYIVIAPKIGFRLNSLPSDYKRVAYNNHNYYNAQGVFYVQINNEYEVVEPEIGTIVYELPDDYEKVAIDGMEYYEYASILYEKVQINGSRAYEVVGFIEME
ncbi:DUF6515 family protein [Arenibacter palladensis]|uniref:DUF6515 family protein n=1 Tax=Arenibacter palladensis TaxID=237373 RepID=UPI0026E1952E|nr:DUF6515 family protein [Arenibacter palladensis]MDO6601843.1 DUF6515 family protein [Arenibacter palladensis]|tara:strand:+ start:9649 stop:10245 length:597 start_codon:yes stop_codon:yes gene_type:complete